MSLPNPIPIDRRSYAAKAVRVDFRTAAFSGKGTKDLAFGVLGLIFFCALVRGSDWDGWQWKRRIQIQGDAAGFVRLTLTPEIVDESLDSLDDLRILDGDRQLVPFAIDRPSRVAATQLQWSSVRLINRAFEEGTYERVVLDFGEPTEKTNLRVFLSGKNYRRRAVVEGSIDSQAWETVLGEAWLFDISSERDSFQVDRLDFPANNFRFLRLTVYHMPDDTGRFSIDDVKTAMRKEPPPPMLEEVSLLKREDSRDEEARATIFDVDLGYRNLPVEKVALTITDPFFYRGFELYGRNSEIVGVKRPTERGFAIETRPVPWQLLSRGVLFRVVGPDREAEDCSVESLNASFRHLRLKIYDHDDRPLTISHVAVYRGALPSLIFEVGHKHSYTLLGGNLNAEAPRFDLGRSVDGLREGNWPAVTAGPASHLESASTTPPWTERNAPVLWAVLILAVAVFAALILKSLKHVKE